MDALAQGAARLAELIPESDCVEITWRSPSGATHWHVLLAGSAVADAPVPTPSAAPPLKLNKTYRKVVKALGRECLDGPEIADRAGYGYGGWFCEQLSDMRLAGVLLGERGEAGYRVAPAYLREAPEGEKAEPEENRR